LAVLPLLLVQGQGVDDDALAALYQTARAQVFLATSLQSSPTTFARHSARVTIVATRRDPLRELVFARTSGFTGPLVLAIDDKYSHLEDDIVSAGALASLTLPIQTTMLNRVLDLVEHQPAAPIAHTTFGLLLDAIDRTVRHRNAVVRLSQREFALLHCLTSHPGGPVAVEKIYDYVWGSRRNSKAKFEIVHVNVSQLRKKLARIGLRGAIRTYRNYGYGLNEGWTD
jgi:DNA-binding response OmpR family regulator